MASGIDHVGEILRAETDAKLAERDARMDKLEAMIDLKAKYRRIIDHEMHDVAYEAMASGEERPWEYAERLDVSIVEYDALAEDYRNGR